MMKYKASTVDELAAVACQILQVIPKGSLVVLVAEMGAGKTTLTQSICHLLGVDPDTMSSPTYSIVNNYEAADGEVHHIDLYRIESLEEAMDAGIEDYLYPALYTFVEWPQVVEPLLPESFWRLDIQVDADGTRSLTVNHVTGTS